MKLTERLSRSPYFGKNTDNKFLDLLLNLVFAQKINKGEFLVKAGEVCDRLIYIQTGLVRIFRTTEEKEITTWFVKEGDFITTVNSFHLGVPSEESFEALEDCVIYSINKKSYYLLAEIISQFAPF